MIYGFGDESYGQSRFYYACLLCSDKSRVHEIVKNTRKGARTILRGSVARDVNRELKERELYARHRDVLRLLLSECSVILSEYIVLTYEIDIVRAVSKEDQYVQLLRAMHEWIQEQGWSEPVHLYLDRLGDTSNRAGIHRRIDDQCKQAQIGGKHFSWEWSDFRQESGLIVADNLVGTWRRYRGIKSSQTFHGNSVIHALKFTPLGSSL